MWVFLGPLIVIMGTMDVITKGRTRDWLAGDQPRDNNPAEPKK